MKQLFAKIACGLATAALAFTLAACDDSSSASVNGPDIEENSSESNGGNGTDSSPSIESSATAESASTIGSSATVNSSATAESSPSSNGSSLPDNSSASLDDNSSSSMAVTCQALTLECYSATQLCNKGLTEYCVNSSSSGKEKCKNVSNIDGGSCQDGDIVKDCETGAYAVCRNNTWRLAIIGDNCTPSGDEMTVNEINLKCDEGYWKYKSTIDKCPPGSSCQRPNYSCTTHPINGFSCSKDNGKVTQLSISVWSSAADCMYYCQNGKYQVVMPPAPVGN